VDCDRARSDYDAKRIRGTNVVTDRVPGLTRRVGRNGRVGSVPLDSPFSCAVCPRHDGESDLLVVEEMIRMARSSGLPARNTATLRPPGAGVSTMRHSALVLDGLVVCLVPSVARSQIATDSFTRTGAKGGGLQGKPAGALDTHSSIHRHFHPSGRACVPTFEAPVHVSAESARRRRCLIDDGDVAEPKEMPLAQTVLGPSARDRGIEDAIYSSSTRTGTWITALVMPQFAHPAGNARVVGYDSRGEAVSITSPTGRTVSRRSSSGTGPSMSSLRLATTRRMSRFTTVTRGCSSPAISCYRAGCWNRRRPAERATRTGSPPFIQKRIR